jgi:hypothetical protein
VIEVKSEIVGGALRLHFRVISKFFKDAFRLHLRVHSRYFNDASILTTVLRLLFRATLKRYFKDPLRLLLSYFEMLL